MPALRLALFFVISSLLVACTAPADDTGGTPRQPTPSDAIPLAGICGEGPVPADAPAVPADVTAAAPDLAIRAGSDRLVIYTGADSALDDDAIRQVAAATCAALDYDLAQTAIGADRPELAVPVRLVLLDEGTYGGATGAPDTYGVAMSDGESEAMIVPETSMGDLVELDDTLAHELTHILQYRVCPNEGGLTTYLLEGTAIENGSAYGVAQHDQATAFVRPYLDDASGADATLTFDRYGTVDSTKNVDQIGHDQAVSAFFVEYLRVKRATPDGQNGFADIEQRLFAAMQRASAGTPLDSAFADQLSGLALDDAKAGFVQFLDDTVGDPASRFGGTFFE